MLLETKDKFTNKERVNRLQTKPGISNQAKEQLITPRSYLEQLKAQVLMITL